MQISKMNHEKLLAAAQHAKAETARAAELQERVDSDERALKNLREQIAIATVARRVLLNQIGLRNETVIQLANRLRQYGDPAGATMTTSALPGTE